MNLGKAIQAASIFLAGAVSAPSLAVDKLASPAIAPGAAVATIAGGKLMLTNQRLRAQWQVLDGRFRAVRLANRLTHSVTALPGDAFVLTLAGEGVIKSSAMSIVSPPAIETLPADTHASQLASKFPGKQIVVRLVAADGRVAVIWRGILRDGSGYVRQQVEILANTTTAISSVRLLDVQLPGAVVIGQVKGSPIVAGDLFLGFEHPLSMSSVSGGRAIAELARELPLQAGQSEEYSSVIGIATAPSQMRRDFLQYLERERAHPYRTFLHYNSWYDLAYFGRYEQAGALAVINDFGSELTSKRQVKLDSFLFDDGWDDTSRLWRFNSGFPAGFEPERAAAAKFLAAPGVWLSPWGGYGAPRQQRIKAGKESGFEMNEGGLMLSGPKYYRYFRDSCLDLIQKYGINQFKIDGTGNADQVFPGSQFDSDFSAAIHLIGEMRAVAPDLFINLTTGTYPSPFWLRYADSIWRGGEDHEFAGVGSDRQRWITYRDGDSYRGIVRMGPLFPLNSLMLHGLIFAKHAHHLESDPQHDFAAEIHSYFGSGTQLQEMYITAALLSPQDWDTLAEAARWSRDRANVMVDTHWIGGDPALLEIYGWAAWSVKLSVVTLRNPSNVTQEFHFDVAKLLELPTPSARAYRVHSPWYADRAQPAQRWLAGRVERIELKPFEVVNLELVPEG